MVFAAVMVAVVALGHALAVEPELVKHKRLSGAMLQKSSEMKAFEAQVAKLVGGHPGDAGRSERERLVRARSELGTLESRIRAEERRFTAPTQMRRVVEGLLARNRGVALEEMKTLAVEALAAGAPNAKLPAKPPAGKPVPADARIYRHGLQLTVSGSYLDLLAYARDLEKLPSQLYWDRVAIDAAAYPKVLMKLTVYTLSLDPAWLNV